MVWCQDVTSWCDVMQHHRMTSFEQKGFKKFSMREVRERSGVFLPFITEWVCRVSIQCICRGFKTCTVVIHLEIQVVHKFNSEHTTRSNLIKKIAARVSQKITNQGHRSNGSSIRLSSNRGASTQSIIKVHKRTWTRSWNWRIFKLLIVTFMIMY